MSHGPHHHHDGQHAHDHIHTHVDGGENDASVDLSIPDAELDPAQLGRRGFLRRAGLLGAGVAGVAAAGALGAGGALGTSAAAAEESGREHRRVPRGGYRWLAGDHHIHTQYSPDAQYRVLDQVQHAAAYGLDWMVITDHGSQQHAKIGVEKVNPDIVAARARFRDETLVFQGLEWNIPAAEHGTVFVHPGRNEVAVLKQFENGYDGVVTNTTASTPANEAVAIAGLDFLAEAVRSRSVEDALMLANHPARKGLDSPHEIRGWRDAQPTIAIGMEGAPGHQAAGIPAPYGPGSGRGYYDNSPSASSFAAYPAESYRTFGGFDWMTATVGGLWDSLLSEGKAWWVTANSDSHMIWNDTSMRGPNDDFAVNGFHADPVHSATPGYTNGDFWPGFYSKTHVGSRTVSYSSVMDGLRAGRVWVDHGGLLESLDVRVRAGERETTLGGVLTARRGKRVTLLVTITAAQLPNWSQFVPKLAKVDLIHGAVTGATGDRDVFTAPRTSVVKSWDTTAKDGTFTLSYDLGRVGDEGFYVRLRGSDGKRLAPGLRGAAVDPAGPQMDVVGDADPWEDLWFYTNPVWVLPT